ncbi:efflux RND transporter periplasmic adaptor subunit [Vibrio rumoiensis]|uniref:Efflux transporter periplasmic adaptor subunit n=1 Tax=Vibrio rumoiensis 1S-45 TaxID=1188252 RepID=A0A1E5E194_9VIBR|nr:efflux RND transporter periplasmic adaptor subunit [Vibrio rumoiensis]OEF24290.1 efflux transporter periplasmic adaptor subunit [Vibrio rumoiensis 1S-45]
MKTFPALALTSLVSLAIGGAASYYFVNTHMSMAMQASSTNQSSTKASADQNEPLYWVAPMDANYRRDKPGKSPMGMDLVPVYQEGTANDDPAGTVMVSPAVENNLGVKVAQVTLSPLSPNIQTVGYIAFDESKLWQTNVRVSGWVQKLNINAVGEKVTKGDVLFTLYSPDLVKAQEELLNAYRTQRQGLINGATERLVTLGVDRAQIQKIVRSGKSVNSVEVKAVNDGIIASLNVREGGYLSPAQAVISAGPIEEVWADAEVFERQGHWITAGTTAEMTLDSIPGQSWQGVVDYVYPILDPKTRTLRVRLKFDNPNGKLKPNMFANISLKPETEGNVLNIPRESVIRSGSMTRVVLAQGEGKFRSARIEIGREADDRIEVLKGLTIKDRVVTSAQFMLDSESSQNAELSRINGTEPKGETVWAEGNINMLMADFGMVIIDFNPIDKWHWKAGQMSFETSDEVDLSPFKAGQTIRFLIEKNKDDYRIIDLQAQDIQKQGGQS